MSIQNTYFDIVINPKDQTFYIVDSSSSSTPVSEDTALETLRKIEHIMKGNLRYDTNHPDRFVNLTRPALFEIFKDQAGKIRENYMKKVSESNLPEEQLLKREAGVNAIYQNIINFKPPASLPLPDILTGMVTGNLSISDGKSFGKVNRKAQEDSDRFTLLRAKEYGYKGRSPQEASNYLRNLFKAINELATDKVIPEKFHARKGEHFDSEAMLRNLQKISTEDLFDLLSNPSIRNREVRDFLFQQTLKVTTVDPTLKSKADKALILAVEEDQDKALVEFLVNHGADINARDIFGCTALYLACSKTPPKLSIIEFLLAHRADPNIDGSFPIHDAAAKGDLKLTQLLLRYGADPNAQNNITKQSSLHLACSGSVCSGEIKDRVKLVMLLLENGGNVSLEDQERNTPYNIAQDAYDRAERDYEYYAKLSSSDRHSYNIADDTRYASQPFDLEYYRPSKEILELLAKRMSA